MMVFVPKGGGGRGEIGFRDGEGREDVGVEHFFDFLSGKVRRWGAAVVQCCAEDENVDCDQVPKDIGHLCGISDGGLEEENTCAWIGRFKVFFGFHLRSDRA